MIVSINTGQLYLTTEPEIQRALGNSSGMKLTSMEVVGTLSPQIHRF